MAQELQTQKDEVKKLKNELNRVKYAQENSSGGYGTYFLLLIAVLVIGYQ
jgi:hypothetical protein